jgi:hypothetical protein
MRHDEFFKKKILLFFLTSVHKITKEMCKYFFKVRNTFCSKGRNKAFSVLQISTAHLSNSYGNTCYSQIPSLMLIVSGGRQQ